MRRLSQLALVVLMGSANACGDGAEGPRPDAELRPRTFRMGFSVVPPLPTSASGVATVNAWAPRADAAIMHLAVPYAAVLGGVTAAEHVRTVDVPLANLYRARGFPLTITIDPGDGLDRAAESPELVALGRSVTEPAVQAVYRQYVVAVVDQLRPEYLGLIAESNLIRALSPPAVYAAMVAMANDAASLVRAMGGTLPALYASVQADVAWGPAPAPYVGVEADFRDFPFTEVLAISSYPYFTFADPDQIPLDYYTRLAGGRTLPVLVVEGGWTSAAVGTVSSSPQTQARYWRRHERLLDSAKAVRLFQLTYTDLDLAAYQPLPPGSVLPLFASNGLVTATFAAKPALATYDSIFRRPVVP
ncbi:MAG: hypothetical protein KJZ74_03455 [Gemmatimonadales bacterium]|nr:hypothetical protein [Gemmatimonadales bacterium]